MVSAGWQLAGSLAAVCLLVLLSWRLGFSGRPELLDEAEARALSSEVPGGFDPLDVELDRSRNGALLRDAEGRVVVVAPAGAHFVARLLMPGARAAVSDGILTVRDGGMTAVLDLGSGAEDWAAAILRLG